MENIFNVSKRQWKKWTPLGRSVFNDVYQLMLDNQEVFTHPDSGMIANEHWETIAWNSAFIAAQAVKDNRVFSNE